MTQDVAKVFLLNNGSVERAGRVSSIISDSLHAKSFGILRR
jgi:hypothetical protein